MRLDKIIRGVAPIVAIVAAAGVAGCNSGKVSFNGSEGVPLADLDMSGAAPEHVALMGSDIVIVHIGTAFAIDVEGSDEARERVRFVLEDETLGILRENKQWVGGNRATVRVTMPAPSTLTIAGSGEMRVDGLAENATVTIAGSGSLDLPEIAVKELTLTVAGSGSTNIGGSAETLALTVAGSGDARMDALQVDKADITIAGAGSATFSSDGEVDATIMGSGNVTVRGSASCTVNSMGSGSLRCERGEEPGDKAA